MGRRDWVFVGGLAALAVVLFCLVRQVHGVDDAFISFRYARNLAAGEGPVYNPGERVYGSTAMAWVGLLAGMAYALRIQVEDAAACSGAVLLALDAALLYALLARATPSRVLRGAGVVLMLLAPHFACVGGLGMETPLYAAFILATLHAVVAGRPVAAGVLAGLTFCTRPDGLAVLCAAVACFGLEALTGSRGAGSSTSSGRAVAWRRLLALGGGFALVAVPFAAWTWSYYGALLPGTLAAKRTHPLVSSRWWMLEHFVAGEGRPVAIATGLLGLAGGAVLLWHRRRGQPLAWHAGHRLVAATAAWFAVYVTAWVAVRIDFYHWYVGAMAPAGAILVVALTMPLWHRRNLLLRAIVLGALAWLTVQSAERTRAELASWRFYSDHWEWLRHRVGEAVHRFTVPDREVLELGAIGIVGYFARDVYVVDRAALVTPLDLVMARTHRRPTLEVFRCAPGEQPPYGEIVYMASTPWTDPSLASDLVLVRLGKRSSFDGTRTMPRTAGDGRLGALRYRGLHPIRMAIAPGGSLQFEPVWTVEGPLPAGAGICYRVGRPDLPDAIRVETRGFFRDRVPYADAEVGRTFVDTITITVPEGLPPGEYALAASGTDDLAGPDAQPVALGVVQVQG